MIPGRRGLLLAHDQNKSFLLRYRGVGGKKLVVHFVFADMGRVFWVGASPTY